jgi:hypothetical protein
MLPELPEIVKVEQTPLFLRLVGFKPWREVRTRKYGGVGGVFEDRSVRYLFVPIIASGEHRVMGGPLDGKRVRLMSRPEQNAFEGGFYRLVESEYWGFSKIMENGDFYFWYQGGTSHPDYIADEWKYGWKREWSLRLPFMRLRRNSAPG